MESIRAFKFWQERRERSFGYGLRNTQNIRKSWMKFLEKETGILDEEQIESILCKFSLAQGSSAQVEQEIRDFGNVVVLNVQDGYDKLWKRVSLLILISQYLFYWYLIDLSCVWDFIPKGKYYWHRANSMQAIPGHNCF
eukprot:TRINITY_DN4487_c0_g1_i7.p3 TRINITY_DN4487_c0_g1~~TRINITY_DN4487_c0_g1_i7.p3  ORF type:complete len:139 (-),score=3.26 TRINITY_DN4487_c0_g1_i7:567-983(-)